MAHETEDAGDPKISDVRHQWIRPSSPQKAGFPVQRSFESPSQGDRQI